VHWHIRVSVHIPARLRRSRYRRQSLPFIQAYRCALRVKRHCGHQAASVYPCSPEGRVPDVGRCPMNDAADARKLRAHVIDDAIIFTAGHPLALVRLGLVPLLCAFLGSNAAALVYPGTEVSRILYALAGIIFAVGVHRMIVRDENPGWVIFRFGTGELAYVGVILLYIVFATSAHHIGGYFFFASRLRDRYGGAWGPIQGSADTCPRPRRRRGLYPLRMGAASIDIGVSPCGGPR
jgi:hypothetical protein